MTEEAKKDTAQETASSEATQQAATEIKEPEMTKEQKEFVEKIEGMSVLDLSKLVKVLED